MRSIPLFFLLGQLATASLLLLPTLPGAPAVPVPAPSAVDHLPPPIPPPEAIGILPPVPIDLDAFRPQTVAVPTPTAPTTTATEHAQLPIAPQPPPVLQGPPSGPHRPSSSMVLAGGECRLMGPFAIVVQLGLGGLALLALVYKRWRERPQRPVRIWLFDVSKQVFGSVLVHVANVFLSLLTSGRLTVDPRAKEVNPCSFYLLNLGIDTTLGIPILLLLLRLTTAAAARTPLGQPPASIQSGNYGHPPRARWWLKQTLLYCVGLFGMKVCVLFLFLALPWLVQVGDWALRWTEGDERLQIVFVMMLFPLLMNALQYYIIDSYIMAAAAAEDKGEVVSAEAPYVDGSDVDGAEDDDDCDDDHFDDDEHDRLLSGACPNKATTASSDACPNKVTVPPTVAEYDPDVDGDSPTIIGSSTSQWSARTAAAAAAAARKASLQST